MSAPAADATQVLAFGPFRLHAEAPRLRRDGQEVRLGGRALDLLLALVTRPGEVLSRAELEARVWPRTFVEDSSLRVHVAALRRALGDGVDGARYIVNVPGRGYCFVAAVSGEETTPAQVLQVPAAGTARRDALPACLPRLIGRDAIAATLCEELVQRRLVSIVGHGGIGKTALAVAVATRVRARFPDGACFVDLAPMTGAAHVVEAVAAALGMTDPFHVDVAALERWLSERRLLILIDNCEHLIDAVAALVERLLRSAPGLVVLATSRESLDAAGEWVHRILPLEAPIDGAPLDAAGALACSAVELLAERAAASQDGFAIDDANAPLAAALCRRLDGVPLAIEFAASRIGLLGLQGVYLQLDDRLRLLGSGRRTAVPRHRTLSALLDWSYDLLEPPQQVVLRRCGVFKGGFTLEAAGTVVADRDLGADDVRDCLLELAAKSLVRVDLTQAPPTYGLLEITRAYALVRLGADADRQAVHRRHAQAMLALVESGAFEWTDASRGQWFYSYAASIGNIRAALDWCFGAEGDRALGIELLAKDWHPVALFLGETEFRERVRAALAAIADGVRTDPLYELRLANIMKHMSSAQHPAPGPTSAGLLALAEQDQDPLAQLEGLYHLCTQNLRDANYDAADRYARRSEATAERCGDAERRHARRLRVIAAHFLGDHAAAADHAAALLRGADPRVPERLTGWVSWRLSVQIHMARLRWIQGSGAEALALAAACVERGSREPFPASLSHALCLAALPVALWHGEHAQACEWLRLLEAHLRLHPQVYFAPWAEYLPQVLALRGVPFERADPAAAPSGPPGPTLLDHLLSFGMTTCHGRASERWRQGKVGWTAPELLRIEGEQLLRGGDPSAQAAAEERFQQALALAQRQGASAFALRAANSLARLRLAQDRAADARALLLPWRARLDAMGGAEAAATHGLLQRLLP